VCCRPSGVVADRVPEQDETVQVLEKADPRVRQIIEQYLTVAA
jgi:hypothetical protein